MQYVLFGADENAFSDNLADAAALQARIDSGMGYPHGSTPHAVSVETKHDGTSKGVAIPQVAFWSWATESYVSATNFLTAEEINALQPFSYLVELEWWGPE